MLRIEPQVVGRDSEINCFTHFVGSMAIKIRVQFKINPRPLLDFTCLSNL